ncbi:thioredoxin domain-containing protein 15 [Belonocnema kinseyi]|uniref:thioredoxin domain-containing protein 15 n=1 Tax=Belonocnema kinseyi TaxID=2817044 RepID=UPI00143DEF51|nr:thioredoxin domain-containing protein 15 [Belonocnema kinseyi]
MHFCKKIVFIVIVLQVSHTTIILGEEETFEEQENVVIEVSQRVNQTENLDSNFTTEIEDSNLLLEEMEDSDTKSNVTIKEPKKNITKVNCLMEKIHGPVEIVNATRLVELLILEPGPANRSRNSTEIKLLPGPCVVVLFYTRWCIFSSHAAPHFNALPRFFPHIKAVAIDAMKYQSFNTQHGIVGVPTLVIFHNGKPVAKFNDTVYTLETFSKFLTHLTNQAPNGSLYVTSADFGGPVSSTPSNDTDYCLVLSWIFIAACALYFTSKSHCWRKFVELVQNTWRESNAQHEHVD